MQETSTTIGNGQFTGELTERSFFETASIPSLLATLPYDPSEAGSNMSAQTIWHERGSRFVEAWRTCAKGGSLRDSLELSEACELILDLDIVPDDLAAYTVLNNSTVGSRLSVSLEHGSLPQQLLLPIRPSVIEASQRGVARARRTPRIFQIDRRVVDYSTTTYYTLSKVR